MGGALEVFERRQTGEVLLELSLMMETPATTLGQSLSVIPDSVGVRPVSYGDLTDLLFDRLGVCESC
jgi:hypothetical protein